MTLTICDTALGSHIQARLGINPRQERGILRLAYEHWCTMEKNDETSLSINSSKSKPRCVCWGPHLCMMLQINDKIMLQCFEKTYITD